MSEDVLTAVTPFACCLIGRCTETCLGRWRTFVLIVVVIVKAADLGFNIVLMVETMNELEEIDKYLSADGTNSETKNPIAKWGTTTTTSSTNTTWNVTLDTSTASNVTWDTSTTWNVTGDTSTASNVTWDTSTTWNVTWDTSTASNVTWVTSTTWNVTWDTSTASNVTWETSTTWNVTWDTSTKWNITWDTGTTRNETWDTDFTWGPTWDTNWNTTDNKTYCTFDTDFDISKKVDLLKTLLIAFQVYIGVAVFLLIFYISAWGIVNCTLKDETSQSIIFTAMGKFQIYLALAYDIPMNTMAIEMQWLHGGSNGIDCWLCSKDSNCLDVEPLSLVSPLKIFSDDQNERAAAELWLTLGFSSVSTFLDMIAVTSPYFVSIMFFNVLCCAKDSDDAPGKCCLVWYAFWGIFAGVNVQMTNLTLMYFHLLPQGDYPWVFQTIISLLVTVALGSAYVDFFLTFCGCCFWHRCCEDSMPKGTAYKLFFWNLVFFAMNLAKTVLPLTNPKESYIMVVAVGGGFIVFWIAIISALLILVCCELRESVASVGRIIKVDDSSNRIHPSTTIETRIEPDVVYVPNRSDPVYDPVGSTIREETMWHDTRNAPMWHDTENIPMWHDTRNVPMWSDTRNVPVWSNTVYAPVGSTVREDTMWIGTSYETRGRMVISAS